MTVIFSDNFETGDLSKWDNTRESGLSIVAVASDRKYSGAYALKSTYEQDGDDGFAYVNFGSNSTVYYRFYVEFDKLPAANSKYFTLCMIMQDDGEYDPPAYYNMAAVYVSKSSSGAVRWLLVARYGGSYTTAGYTYDDPPVADTQFLVELKVQCSSGGGAVDGEYILYINGVARVMKSNVDTTYTYVDFLRCGVDRNTTDNQSNAVWIDSVVVADAYVGAESGVVMGVLGMHQMGHIISKIMRG